MLLISQHPCSMKLLGKMSSSTDGRTPGFTSTRAADMDAGTLLRSLSLPTSLHAVAADPAEHALYLAGGDGRIFEASLVGDDDGGRDAADAAGANGLR